jgi:prolyl-tRNA editing enzyme YbaK/EbsC (Cys-tRNA(Pro) deacylase)
MVSPMDADTPATRVLAGSGLFVTVVRTARPSSVEESATLQGIEVAQLLRTIVVRRGADDYVFVVLRVKRLSLADQDQAREVTGYERGAITPFGSVRAWPVVADASVERLERVAIGGGAHGVNLHLAPGDLISYLGAEVGDVTRPARA